MVLLKIIVSVEVSCLIRAFTLHSGATAPLFMTLQNTKACSNLSINIYCVFFNMTLNLVKHKNLTISFF